MRRRRRRRPLESVRVPRILRSLRALVIAVDDVREEEELRGAEHESAYRNKLVDRNDRLEEVVLLRIVDSPHVPGHPEDMHREEGAVEGDERDPEVNLAERLVHHAAEHLGVPIGNSREDAEQATAE